MSFFLRVEGYNVVEVYVSSILCPEVFFAGEYFSKRRKNGHSGFFVAPKHGKYLKCLHFQRTVKLDFSFYIVSADEMLQDFRF